MVILKKKLNRGGVPLNFYEGRVGVKNIILDPTPTLNFFSLGGWGLKILVWGVGLKIFLDPHPTTLKFFVISF